MWLGLFTACGLAAGSCPGADTNGAPPLEAGPFVHEFKLTLESGRRREAAGPFYFAEEAGERRSFGMPPFFSMTTDAGIDSTEFDILYPFISLDRYGTEYRWHVMQLLNLSSGQTIADEVIKERFTVFPFYFQQRSPNTNYNYTALLPFYGHLKDRLLRDEVFFVMFPFYAQSRRRDVVTDNYFYPFFHRRHGNGLEGWQLWPLAGSQHKAVTTRTNSFNEIDIVPGHDQQFVMWPFYANQHTGIGTENPDHTYAVLPLFSVQRSPQRDSTSVMWPFVTYTDDRAKKYREWDVPWPLMVFARGEGKHGNRVWPFFSRMENDTLRNEFYLWPLYLGRHVHSPPLERHRHRWLLFGWSDLTELNLDTGKAFRRVDCWPLFTWRSDREGRERLQVFAPIEPMLPGNKSVERNWSPLWSVWREERNASTQSRSQSFLWNLWRRDTTPDMKKSSLLFGLIQYQNDSRGARWRFLHLPSKAGETNGTP